MPRGKCTNENFAYKNSTRRCFQFGKPQTIALSKPFVCAGCGVALTAIVAAAAAAPAVVEWTFERAQAWASSADPVYNAPKANLATFEFPGATSRTLALDIPSGRAAVRVFSRSASRPANPDMVVLVCHGRQRSPARSSGHGARISAFAFLVPLGTTLFREALGAGGASQAALKFASAPLAFATAGPPDAYVGHHSQFELENVVVVGLSRVLPVCDIAIITDMHVSGDADADCRRDEKVPLWEILSGTDLGSTYRNYLMMCCRSPWPPPASGAAPMGELGRIYAFNDDFSTSAES